MAAVHQDDADKRINFKNAFTFLAPSCPVIAKAAKKGSVSFEANVSGTGGKPHQGGLGGDREKLGRERLGSPFITTSSKNIGTCPRNSKKS